MIPDLSRAKAFCGLAALLALGACQTTDGADPNSSLTTAGDFQELAGCYARSQNAVASRLATGASGTRSVSVTSVAVAPAATSALGRSSSKSTEEAVESVGAASYRVTFRELPDNRTQVSGTTVGAATQPFTWFNTVVPALRNCTGNPDLS